MALPAPSCALGYTTEDLKQILGSRLNEFHTWMVGQTASYCDGKRWNYPDGDWEPAHCGPHGFAYHPWDVQRFLDGSSVVD